MRKSPRLIVVANNFIMIILAVILVAIWIAFAPITVGGQASYVIVTGISMLPGFHTGDLAIMKAASIYNVGDVVVYYEPASGEKIIHRIIEVKVDRYIMKGDNNTWIDPHSPTNDEIIGKLWIHIPKLGLTLQKLRSPINMAFIVGILGGVFMIEQDKKPKKHGKQKNKAQGGGGATGWVEMVLYILGFLTLAFLALSIFTFTRPTTRPADDIEYEQTGNYYYSAAMPSGIFDTETLHSGEPVFTKLTCSIIIGYSYNVTGPLEDVSGTQQLVAQISDPGSGWGRTIPLTAVTSFSGTSYSTTTTVDLCQFQSLVNTVSEKTGFQPNSTLKIISKMTMTAKAIGQPVYDTFESDLVFQFGNTHYFLAKNGEADPLQSSKVGKIINPNKVENIIKFLGNDLNVIIMRTLGIAGLSISLLGLLILSLYIYEVSKHSQKALINIRYGSMLMEVHDRSFENISSVIEVTSIDDLAKLAERQNAMILHTTHATLGYYFVQSDNVTYRYTNQEEHKGQPTPIVKQEIQQTIIPPSETPPNLEDIINEEPAQTNSLPKKITIAYNGPLPYNDQGEPELPLK